MKLSYFRDISFLQAIKALFNELNVPVNYVADEPTSAQEILKDTYKENSTFQLVNEVYFVGMVDDAAFEGNKSLAVDKIKSDYDGILIFGVSLNQRENNLLPTRSQLAEISRAFNREFYYTPVVLVFKYADDKEQYIAFANTERLQYKQAWREGEKAGKVSLLRDIDIQRPHRGHEDIINQLRIQTSGTKAVDTFAKLYAYWQEVFSVSVLNKRFYQELSNWYFWAVKQVTFPDKPTEADAIKKNAKLDDLIQEHNATNVIRLLTRLLFTWFIKEKKLIPEELFDLEALQKDILNDIAPYHENGLFNQANKDSVYYRAILQNLFFASLNCPIKPDGTDSRERGFRGDESRGKHFAIDWMLRYKKHFKNPDAFLDLLNSCVPFLNGGLFECLDDKPNKIIVDGFSDNENVQKQLIVPDYLFFGTPEEVDLSTEYGVNNNTTKKAAVKGLINILKSYKFTITENTPIEEDVALDPELLGKVFENLLASYNPETKTTARKQTGSFYTPREIVNYMVDESLIAYLKNAVTDWEMDEKQVDEKLHQLASFDAKNPFADNQKLTRNIVSALDRCKILDPACGSGAFPMGVLQKMVHMLQKLDPDNLIWKEVQIQKVQEETSEVFKTIDDKAEREEKLKEINNAFDQRVNDPDYARKLYLIENCIYGVDIQPIATQISKLRFFISLVVDQKSNTKADENFGIRPLPNLETKFVTANTLIGINKEANLFTTDTVKDLEKQLKHIRHKLFSARTKDTKLKYRQKDEELRKTIAEELKSRGLPIDSAEKLAKWDPYDQNASSPFFDPEWMFDLADGFDVVIGNPPYLQVPKGIFSTIQYPYSEGKDKGKQNLYKVFVEASKNISKKESGSACLIVQSSLLCDLSSQYTRELLLKETSIIEFIEFPKIAPTKEGQVFENVLQGTCVYRFINRKPNEDTHFRISINNDVTTLNKLDFEHIVQSSIFSLYPDTFYIPLVKKGDFSVIKEANNNSIRLSNLIQSISQGDINLTSSKSYFTSENTGIKLYRGKNVQRFYLDFEVEEYLKKGFKSEKIQSNSQNQFVVCQEITGTTDKYRLHFCLTPLGDKFLFGHTANKLFLISKSDNKSIASINNSIFMDWLFRKTSTNNHVMGYEITQFPIPKLFKSYISILNLFYDLLSHCNRFQVSSKGVFELTLNSFVFNLYFPNHMREREIDVLQFVERDIEKVMQGREFEKLSDTEKEQVIEQLHQTWSHPDSEVRNRIKLFAVRSPEILKPILES
ncbi:MAG TPA: Eco57I restriction-modification methylase domain-containing protein [Bacteroidales bacterium]|nr:Eco57I restriction-modification methylase domain-containing protein [Bacteroidales bacterium]